MGKAEGATLFMTMLTAFKVLLARNSNHEDVVVGSPIAQRSSAEAEALIGFCLNTLVLRTRLEGDPTFRDALGARSKEIRILGHTNAIILDT